MDGLDEALFGTAGIGHADAMETSMIAHVAGDLLREAALEAAEAGGPDDWGEEVHGAAVGFDTADFSDSGAVGDPTDGDAEKGRKLYAQATDELDRLVSWLAAQPFEDLLPEPHG